MKYAVNASVSRRKNKAEKALIVSSVKTYLGHLESAAGIAGIIKTVLSIASQLIPKHLHFKTLNPAISLEGLNAAIPLEGMTWPKTSTPKRAGVSSFGFSGINAHVILEEAPQDYVSQRQGLPAIQFNRQAVLASTQKANLTLFRQSHIASALGCPRLFK